MKKMKKLVGILLTGILAVSLSACGGSSVRADSEYEGTYISVAGEAMGMVLTGDDVSGFSLDLQANGKGTMTVDEDSSSMKWQNDDTTLTITVEGEDMVAELGEDILIFDDMLGMGMKVTFAKEGTDAANPDNYLPEEEKNMIGTWASSSVADVLGNDASADVDPAAVTIEFFSDHTAKATFNGTDLGESTWTLFSESGYFDDDYLLTKWSMAEDAIEVTYSDEDHYWNFICTKQ